MIQKKRSLTTFVVQGLVGIILAMQIGAGAIGYYEFTMNLQNLYKNTTASLAETASHVVDPDSLERYLETGEPDAAYHNIYDRFQNLVDSSGANVLYVAKIDPVAGTRTYVYNVVGENFSEPYPLGYVGKASQNILEGYQVITSDPEVKNYLYTSNDANGKTTTTLVPIYKDGEVTAVCCIVMPMTLLASASHNFLAQLAILSTVLVVICGAAWYIQIRKKIISPLKMISHEASRFSQEGGIPDESLYNQIRQQSEIGDLASAVDEMEHQIVDNVLELIHLMEEKNRLDAELDIATKIQASALPQIREGFPGRKELDIAALMKPAKEVGGDFYDFFFIDEDHMALVIADVSGKGVPAALFMMVSKVLIKTHCMNANYDAGAILTAVNEKLCEDNKADMFVTVWLGIIELSTGKIYASNAGHEFPIISGADGTFELLKDRHGFVLGGMDGIKERTYTFQMNPGDTLLVYTDGIPEAINSQNEQFGIDRAIKAMNNCETPKPDKLIDCILASMDEFVGEAEQFDDTTMLCVRYNGA